MPTALDEKVLLEGVAVLASRDPDLAGIVDRLGPPPLWAREPGFETLVRIILEQQVSLASAAAIFDRLRKLVVPLAPREVLRLGPQGLRPAGLTAQKGRFVHELARAVRAGDLDLEHLGGIDSATAREALLRVKGVGPWTAEIYLLMVLGRPDIWPVGDLALVKSVKHLKRLDSTPGPTEMIAMAEDWRPWRSVAARLLWHHYLSDDYPGRGA